MPIEYTTEKELFAEGFEDFSRWHHEGVGGIEKIPGGKAGMRLTCAGSRQGAEGCMAFFRPTLPDLIAVEYELTVHSHGGLVINYIAIRGLKGEDLIEDRDKLPRRTGVMADYYAAKGGLQSYHVSMSRFDDQGRHTGTSNWRRNPGMLLAGHGVDPCKELRRTYRIRLTKDRGHLQLYVDGQFAHAMIDRDASRYPIPDTGKFGFRLIGSNVSADVSNFHVYQIATKETLWKEAKD